MLEMVSYEFFPQDWGPYPWELVELARPAENIFLYKGIAQLCFARIYFFLYVIVFTNYILYSDD